MSYNFRDKNIGIALTGSYENALRGRQLQPVIRSPYPITEPAIPQASSTPPQASKQE